MTETIKNYGELKQLINHGDKVTLEGKLMTNKKVDSMPMAEVRLCIEQGDFKSNPAIEGEFIGKDDKPFDPMSTGAAEQSRLNVARAQQHAAMANAQMQAQSQFYNSGMAGQSGLGGLGQSGLGGIFGGLF
jgi:hypothetical protein